MGKDINYVNVKGRAGKDAEVKHTSGGKLLVKFSLANGGGKKKDGGEYPTDWFSVESWDVPEAANVTKGCVVEVKGRLRENKWEDRQSGAKRSMVVIVATEVILESSQDRDIHDDVKPSRQRTQAQARPVTEADPISDSGIPW